MLPYVLKLILPLENYHKKSVANKVHFGYNGVIFQGVRKLKLVGPKIGGTTVLCEYISVCSSVLSAYKKKLNHFTLLTYLTKNTF